MQQEATATASTSLGPGAHSALSPGPTVLGLRRFEGRVALCSLKRLSEGLGDSQLSSTDRLSDGEVAVQAPRGWREPQTGLDLGGAGGCWHKDLQQLHQRLPPHPLKQLSRAPPQ